MITLLAFFLVFVFDFYLFFKQVNVHLMDYVIFVVKGIFH